MERNTFSMRLQQTKFKDIWKQWKMYISLQRPSVVKSFFLRKTRCFTALYYYNNRKHPVFIVTI